MTQAPDPSQPLPGDDELRERLRGATALLEAVAADTSLLDQLDTEERHRLQRAIAAVYHPDPALRRQRLKAAEKARVNARIQQDEAILHNTGIRALRRRPVFTTPNVFPPENFRTEVVDDEDLVGSPGTELEFAL